jgi:hypothetical protein
MATTSSDNMMCCGNNKFEENESLSLLVISYNRHSFCPGRGWVYCEGWEEMTEREEER